MSESDESNGRQKPYAPGNTREDGSYKVGKNRAPEHTRFAVGDGRKRGRRPKGVRNFDTEFEEESRRRISLREGSNVRKVSKRLATIIKTFDSALTKGDMRAASLIFSQSIRIGDQRNARGIDLASQDDAELSAWLRERLAVIEASEAVDPGDADLPGHQSEAGNEQ